MAAVSTNYGTAGDSTLESSLSRSRSTKDGSKSGSGSGSNSASRSASQSRVQRKRAGTGSRSLICPVVGASGSGTSKNQDPAPGLPRIDASSRAQGAVGNSKRSGADSAKWERVREPMHRSMFPIGAPRKKTSFVKVEKGKHAARAGSASSFLITPDLIELAPRMHIRNASTATDRSEREGADKMVIHKEVRYSIQYEDEAELSRMEDPRNHSVDVSAYV